MYVYLITVQCSNATWGPTNLQVHNPFTSGDTGLVIGKIENTLLIKKLKTNSCLTSKLSNSSCKHISLTWCVIDCTRSPQPFFFNFGKKFKNKQYGILLFSKPIVSKIRNNHAGNNPENTVD